METNAFWSALAVLRKRAWIILLVFAATMGLIVYREYRTPPSYRSTVPLQVIPLEPEEVPLFTRQTNVSTEDTIDLISYQFSSLVRSPRIAQLALNETGVAMSASDLAARVAVDRDPAGDLVNVSATALTPTDAEKLVTALVEIALVEFRQGRALPAVVTGKFLDEELAAADAALVEARDALLQFKLKNGVEFIDREISAEQDAVRTLASEAAGSEAEAVRLDVLVAELERQVSSALKRVAELPEEHPDRPYWTRLAQDLNTAVINRRAEASAQRSLAVSAKAQRAQHEGDLAALISLGAQSGALEATAQDRQETRDLLAAKAREARLKISQARSIGYLQVIGAPATPRSELSSRAVQTAALAGALSLLAGGLLVFAIEFLDQGLRRSSREAPSEATRKA
jgi:uncharacterized protein involved in exopolysaccharide biosynthesis